VDEDLISLWLRRDDKTCCRVRDDSARFKRKLDTGHKHTWRTGYTRLTEEMSRFCADFWLLRGRSVACRR